MKKLLNVLTGLCLLAGIFAGCEKKPLDDDNPNEGGGSTHKGTIEGIVTDKATNKPILLASVTLQPTNTMRLTDTAGYFKLSDIEPGDYKLQFKHNGYSTFTTEDIKVEGGKTVRYNAVLESLAAVLQILDADGQAIGELNVGSSAKGVFVLKNASKEIVEWEIPKLATEWITGFSKQSGKLAPDAEETVEFSLDRDKLTDGTNEATLYIGSNVGDKQLLIKAEVSRSYCFTDDSGVEISEVELLNISHEYRFQIKNTGSDALTWELAAIDWADWLQWRGKTEGTLAAGESEFRTLRIIKPSLYEGNYETRINFSSNAGEKTLPVSINIKMDCQLEDKNGAEISELNMERATKGSFKIKNTGTGKLTWEVLSAEADWLTLGDTKSGELLPDITETIDVTVDASLLTEGDNQTTVKIRTNAGDKQLQIRAYRLQLSDVLPEMVYVEGGTFMMGGTEEQGDDASDKEKPVHEVTLDNFSIGKYEITQAQWEFIMGTTVAEQRDKANPSFDLAGVGDDYPIYYISWNEAVAFCAELSRRTGKTYRLPTEAEWEYAARGGQHADNMKYAGSNMVGEVAWYDGNSGEQTHPTGMKKPNGLGLYDMSGNVYEWCSDWYGKVYYSSSPSVNPQGPSSGTVRVLRGGNFVHDASTCRVSHRSSDAPDKRFRNIGLRVILEP